VTLLAEVVRRVDGRPFEQYVREEVFLPLGMDDCWVGMPKEHHAAYGERIGTMHNTQGEAPVALDALDGDDTMAQCVPGGGGRGPTRQLARLYRALLGGGALDGVRVLSPQTVAAVTARHRVGLFDETFHCQCDWGLGFAAVQTNGMCASDDHYHRLDDVMTAIYVDLGIAAADTPGRDKPMPRLGL
jgi:CubicO group peptidase (beta-lactamase class C family)